MSVLSVSDAARKISAENRCIVAPNVISFLFYRRLLDDERCPIVGRARLIPADYIPVIVAELRRRGLLTEQVRA